GLATQATRPARTIAGAGAGSVRLQVEDSDPSVRPGAPSVERRPMRRQARVVAKVGHPRRCPEGKSWRAPSRPCHYRAWPRITGSRLPLAGTPSSVVRRQVQTLFRFGTLGDATDGQLLERFVAGGDEVGAAALAALVERHGPMVLRACRRILGDAH